MPFIPNSNQVGSESKFYWHEIFLLIFKFTVFMPLFSGRVREHNTNYWIFAGRSNELEYRKLIQLSGKKLIAGNSWKVYGTVQLIKGGNEGFDVMCVKAFT